MAKRNTTHVVLNQAGGWSVKAGGAKRAAKCFETKKEAVDFGRQMSKSRNSEFIIHRKDGTIQKSDSHGGAPPHFFRQKVDFFFLL